MNFELLQQEVGEWLKKQPFGPGQQPWEPLMGIGEEVGELQHAHLKLQQGIRGTPAELEAKARDAVGDIIIYTAGFCNAMNLDMFRNAGKPKYKEPTSTAVLLAVHARSGFLTQEFLDGASPIDLEYQVSMMIRGLYDYCQVRGWTLDECVHAAKATVLSRDWNVPNG